MTNWYRQPELTGEEDLIVFRHAQSNFNRGFLNYRIENNLHDLPWEECIKIDQFNEKVSYAHEHFDCSITQDGRKQCQLAKEKLQDQQIDIVLVSPHQRALETCNEVYGDRNIPIEVHPILAEVFRFSCDISQHIEEKKKQFPKFDFSHMKDLSELWFIEILSDKHAKNTFDHIQKHSPQTYQEKQHRILELIKEKVVYQSAQELRERIWKVKQLLVEYKKIYKKIAIVSHFHVVIALIADGYDQEGEVINPPLIQNATPIYAKIDELAKRK